MHGIGPKLPLAVDDVDGHFGLIKTLGDEVQQNLKHLILTSPGERVMDINFGVGIRRFLFEQMVPQTQDKIESRILSQVRQYLPFVKITKIDFNTNEFLNLLNIAITYNVSSINKNDKIVIDLT